MDGVHRYYAAKLKKAGTSLREAVKYHIPVDPRRKTAHDENVKILQAMVEEKKTAARSDKPTGKSKS